MLLYILFITSGTRGYTAGCTHLSMPNPFMNRPPVTAAYDQMGRGSLWGIARLC
jgi:hypothetical protein